MIITLPFLLAPDKWASPLPLGLYSIGCHEQHYVLRPDGHHTHQLFWALRGKGSCNLLNGSKFILETGHALFLPAEVPHEYYALPGERWMVAFVGLGGTAAEAIAAGCGIPFQTPFPLKKPEALWPGLEGMWKSINAGTPGQEKEYSRDLYALLLETGVQFREASAESGSHTDPNAPYAYSQAARKPESAALSQTLRFMMEHFNEPLSMTNLAGVAGYSVQHFQRLFKKHYGLSPHAYLQQIRLQHSVDWLLGQPELEIREIAARLGWEPNYYIRVFRSRFGMSPARYRRLRPATEPHIEPRHESPTP